MDIKRLFAAIAFRALLIAPIVVGLCFIYPPALGIFVGVGALTLASSVAFSVYKHRSSSYLNDIPIGDLEYHNLPKESFYTKIETKVLDAAEDISCNIKNRIRNKKRIGNYKKSDNKKTLSK